MTRHLIDNMQKPDSILVPFLSDIVGLNRTNLKDGFTVFCEKLKENGQGYSDKEYIYINVWSVICKPCIDEIPFIGTLEKLVNKNLDYYLVCFHSDKAIETFLRNNNIKSNNLTFVNGMTDFISGIFNEIEENNLAFPLHAILNKQGDCLAYLFGSIHDEKSAAPLINFINSL